MAPSDETVSGPALDEAAGRELAGLLERAEGADDAPALNEAGRLNLVPGRSGVVHLLRRRYGTLVGYAQLEDGDATSTGQVVVEPAARRTGVGTALVAELRRRAAHPLQVWAVGDTPAAAALARRSGLAPVRTLLVMTRSLSDLPPPRLPDGVRIDTFRPEVDGPAWLVVNRRAFAHHPEQGAITAEDLALRLAEPWFDREGFFLARGFASAGEWNPAGGVGGRPPSGQGATDRPAGPLLGFHWTKRHGAGGHGDGGLGEVYVIGVDPDAQGRGLAKALLLTGLAYLRDSGDTTVQLYVEASATGAVGLYDAHGFRVSSRDVMYGEPVDAQA